MKLNITYTADADEIGALIEDLPDNELRKLANTVELLPELFPTLTRTLVEYEVLARDSR